MTIHDFLITFVTDLNVVVYENEITEYHDRIVCFEGRIFQLRLKKDLLCREIFQIQYCKGCLFIFLM